MTPFLLLNSPISKLVDSKRMERTPIPCETLLRNPSSFSMYCHELDPSYRLLNGQSCATFTHEPQPTDIVDESIKSEKVPKLSYYKRALPVSCVSFTSPNGRDLFREALDGSYMESYFPLSMQFLTQSEPAYCGLGSLCMILNSLEIDPMRQWKGVWRWYDESMLDCCRSLEEIKVHGITLNEFECIALCNGLEAETFRGDEMYFLEIMNQIFVDKKKSL